MPARGRGSRLLHNSHTLIAGVAFLIFHDSPVAFALRLKESRGAPVLGVDEGDSSAPYAGFERLPRDEKWTHAAGRLDALHSLREELDRNSRRAQAINMENARLAEIWGFFIFVCVVFILLSYLCSASAKSTLLLFMVREKQRLQRSYRVSAEVKAKVASAEFLLLSERLFDEVDIRRKGKLEFFLLTPVIRRAVFADFLQDIDDHYLQLFDRNKGASLDKADFLEVLQFFELRAHLHRCRLHEVHSLQDSSEALDSSTMSTSEAPQKRDSGHERGKR